MRSISEKNLIRLLDDKIKKMREIYYNSDITPKAVNELKLLSLYYDKISIVNDAVYRPIFDTSDGKIEFAGTEAIEFIPKSFREDYKLFLDEGLIELTKRTENETDEYEKLFAEKISHLVNSSYDYLFPIHPGNKDGRIITEEVYDIMKSMRGFEFGKPIESEFVWWYYSFKLKWFLKLLIEGKNCISSSDNLQVLFSKFIQETTRENRDLGLSGYSKSLAYDALKVSLPNPDVLSFEDILELKLKLKDELGLFQQTISSIEQKNKEVLNPDISSYEYQTMFFNEIEKPLKDLEIKIQNLKSKTFRTFIEKIKDPYSYAPLIGTMVASIPIQYTMLASFGLNGLTSYMEYAEDKREISNNGLYFLLKLK